MKCRSETLADVNVAVTSWAGGDLNISIYLNSAFTPALSSAQRRPAVFKFHQSTDKTKPESVLQIIPWGRSLRLIPISVLTSLQQQHHISLTASMFNPVWGSQIFDPPSGHLWFVFKWQRLLHQEPLTLDRPAWGDEARWISEIIIIIFIVGLRFWVWFLWNMQRNHKVGTEWRWCEGMKSFSEAS